MRVKHKARGAKAQSKNTSWRNSRWTEFVLEGGKWVRRDDVDPPVFPRDVGPINEVTVRDGSGRMIAYMLRDLP